MNPDTNKFLKVQQMLVRPNGTPVPSHWSIFMVGENYVINGYTFKCKYIGETSILFEPVGPVVLEKKDDFFVQARNLYRILKAPSG